MIDGVYVKKLRVISDERGYLMEILRCDDQFFNGFGQVYMTTVYPGVVKGWHYHLNQSDYMTCVSGMVKLVLYDGREGSSTFAQIDEFFIGDQNPTLVCIPAKVIHGFKGIGDRMAVIINTITQVYDYHDPDEQRLPWNSSQIPYDWSLKNG